MAEYQWYKDPCSSKQGRYYVPSTVPRGAANSGNSLGDFSPGGYQEKEGF